MLIKNFRLHRNSVFIKQNFIQILFRMNQKKKKKLPKPITVGNPLCTIYFFSGSIEPS